MRCYALIVHFQIRRDVGSDSTPENFDPHDEVKKGSTKQHDSTLQLGEAVVIAADRAASGRTSMRFSCH